MSLSYSSMGNTCSAAFLCKLLCLRNRKHVLCLCCVIETRVEVWENEKCCGKAKCFHGFFEFSWSSILFYFFYKIPWRKQENDLFTLINQRWNLFARAIITSTAHAICVFPLSYTNMTLNQLPCILSLGYFVIIMFWKVIRFKCFYL